MSKKPDYEALLYRALAVYEELDIMMDGFLDTSGASSEEIDRSRTLYNKIAAIHRDLGHDYKDLPLILEEEDEPETEHA